MSQATALTSLSATTLARMLGAREVSSEEVTRAHLERIEAIDGKVRAFTVVLRDEALAAARRSDDERRKGHTRGPLHGLPVSVKESIDMTGQASTLGAVSRAGIVAAGDGATVELLREGGAVILGRTNVSQILLFHESRNPLFGQTANPWSLAHTPGGSSGGEAAAIAAGMSPMGIGTDVGGSIRVPAAFTGIAGLKPTLDRWSNLGSNSALAGQEVVRSQIGPLARDARDVALLFNALDPARMSWLDPRVPPLPAEDPAGIDVGKLGVGFYADDGVVPSSAAVARAVRLAAERLRGRGVRVVELTPPGIPEATYAYFAAMSADGGVTAQRTLAGGAVDPTLTAMYRLVTMPAAVRRALARVMGAMGERRAQRLLEVAGEKTVAELWRITAELRKARLAVLASMREADVDVLLCPAFATPALPHGASKDFALAGSTSMLFNAVQFPAGVVPVTRVERGEARRALRRDRFEKLAAAVDEQSAGLPVGVQVVGRPWEDATVLAVMIALDDALTSSRDRPVTPHFAG